MTANAASRKDIRAAEKASRQVDRTRGEVIVALMSATSGRQYVWEQLSASHIFSTSYSADALQMAFSEGERNTGLRLLDDILTSCPEQFIYMIREQDTREQVNGRLDRSPDGKQSGSEDGDGGTEDVESFSDDPGSDVYGNAEG